MIELPRKPRGGDCFELTVERLDADARGVAKLACTVGPQKAPRHYPVAIADALPQERLTVELGKRKRRSFIGFVQKRHTQHPHRIPARCRHFGGRFPSGGCGGCRLQSLSYAEQLAHKRTLVAETLQGTLNQVLPVEPVLGMTSPWFYRNKMEFSFGSLRECGLALGLHPSGMSGLVLPISECYLQSEFSAEVVRGVTRWARELQVPAYHHRRNTGWLRTLTIREGKRTGQRLVELLTSDAETVETPSGNLNPKQLASALCDLLRATALEQDAELTSFYWTQHCAEKGRRTVLREALLHGSACIRETLTVAGNTLSFEVHPRAFFQPNTEQAERLYQQIINAAELDRGADHVLDLYCGTGTIGLALAPHVRRVTGIELSVDAVENATRNAETNGIDNTTFHAGDAAEVLRDLKLVQDQSIDLVIVDPPRAGLSDKALALIGEVATRRLIYVSCNPLALARDLKALSHHGFRAEHVQPVDMFPHTAHVETVVRLARPAS